VLLGLPWSLDIVLITSSYYLMGYYFSGKVLAFSPSTPYSIIALIVFSASHVLANQTIDLNIRKYDGHLIPVLESLSGIYLALVVCHFTQYLGVLGRAF